MSAKGRAMMVTHVEDLPDELLLRILDLLPHRDLVDVVPDVCLRWSRLILDSHIWKYRTYYVGNESCDTYAQSLSKAAKFFSRKPALRSVHFLQGNDEAVLRILASNCPTITTLFLYSNNRCTLDTLRLITRNCDQIRELLVPSEFLSCPDYAREVALMPRLETLYVEGRQPLQLRELGSGCARLRHLDLHRAENFCLGDLGASLLRRLQGLAIYWKFVSRDIVECAESLEKLKLYYDESPRPVDAVVEDLMSLKVLTHVTSVNLCRSPQALRALMQPLLRSLYLLNCVSLDDDLLLELCRRCPLLEELNLSGCRAITARGLSSMWSLRWLRRLRLKLCTSLRSGAMTHLARCDGLQELRMKFMDMDCMEPGVSQLLELSKLRVLQFNAWSARDLIPWVMLPKAFPELRILKLGEWMSQDTSLPESLKAAMPTTQVKWHISWKLRLCKDAVLEEQSGNLETETEPEEPDMDLFIFQEL